MEPRKDIIEAIKQGKTIKEVAQATNTSPATVSLHKRLAGLSKTVKKRKSGNKYGTFGIKPSSIPLAIDFNKLNNADILKAVFVLLKQIN